MKVGDIISVLHDKLFSNDGTTMENLKKLAAEKAVEYIKDGMVVGLGTGTTAIYAIKKIAELNLDIIGIATSKGTERIAKKLGIKLSNLDEVGKIDITIDGADEIDKNLNLIKGRGGALVREKIVAMHTENEIIVADGSKLVKKLGEKCALPIEIIRFAPFSIAKRIEEKFGCKTGLRKYGNKIFKTDNGNYILDCRFNEIRNPRKLEIEINSIPGVVDNGLFISLAKIAIVSKPNGLIELRRKGK